MLTCSSKWPRVPLDLRGWGFVSLSRSQGFGHDDRPSSTCSFNTQVVLNVHDKNSLSLETTGCLTLSWHSPPPERLSLGLGLHKLRELRGPGLSSEKQPRPGTARAATPKTVQLRPCARFLASIVGTSPRFNMLARRSVFRTLCGLRSHQIKMPSWGTAADDGKSDSLLLGVPCHWGVPPSVGGTCTQSCSRAGLNVTPILGDPRSRQSTPDSPGATTHVWSCVATGFQQRQVRSGTTSREERGSLGRTHRCHLPMEATDREPQNSPDEPRSSSLS